MLVVLGEPARQINVEVRRTVLGVALSQISQWAAAAVYGQRRALQQHQGGQSGGPAQAAQRNCRWKNQNAAGKKGPSRCMHNLDRAQLIVHLGSIAALIAERPSLKRNQRDKIDGMSRGSWFRLNIFVAGFVLAAGSLAPTAMGHGKSQHGRKYKPPPPAANIEVDVVRARDGKPIQNAAVIFHPVEGERDKGSVELKSNSDGKATVQVLAIGDTVELQVIAQGFQTYGGECSINKPQMVFRVRLDRPQEQYSIYTPHSGTSNNGEGNCGEIEVTSAPAGGSAAPQSGQSPPN